MRLRPAPSAMRIAISWLCAARTINRPITLMHAINMHNPAAMSAIVAAARKIRRACRGTAVPRQERRWVGCAMRSLFAAG